MVTVRKRVPAGKGVYSKNMEAFASDEAKAEARRKADTAKAVRYYYRNREKILAERRARYQEDARVRAQKVEQQRKYRFTAVDARNHKTMIDGEYVSIVRPATAAENAGVSRTSLLKWEEVKYVPKALTDSRGRYYTMYQAKLLIEFAEFLLVVRGLQEGRSDRIKEFSAYIFQNWNRKE